MKDLKQTDPVEHIATLYRDKITSLVTQKEDETERGLDTSYTQIRLDRLCEALTALDKVRELQLYQSSYDNLTVAHRRKINENVNKIC